MKMSDSHSRSSFAVCKTFVATMVTFLVATASADVIFEENFDGQPDWNSGLEVNDKNFDGKPDTIQDINGGHTLPGGWDSVRQDPTWAPSTGHSDRHENIEIVSRNEDKARGGSGKSMVVWRDSATPDWKWNSDGILSKKVDGFESIYVSFWIKFSPDWTPFGETGMTKLFRVSSYDGFGPIYKAFEDGNSSAIMVWDYRTDEYGARNKLAVRGDPQETNYFITSPEPINLPRQLNSGGLSLNFTQNVVDLDGDGEKDQDITSLINLKTNQPIDPSDDVVTHDELWGDQWHKVEFFLKMNSSPGAMDGVLDQWIDGQLVFSNKTFPWMGTDSPGGLKWNVVHFGGNSHFHAFPDTERREEWYSIDDIVIRSDMPGVPPNSPNSLLIQ